MSLAETAAVSPARSESPWPFLLPLAAFLLLGSLEPRFDPLPATETPPAAAESAESLAPQAARNTRLYLAVVGVKLVAMLALLVAFFPVYRRHFPLAIDRASWIVGVAGAALWILLASPQLELRIAESLGVDGSSFRRSAFNPFEQLESTTALAAFLAARFGLLVVAVPLAEELFLRGWLMRWLHADQWSSVPLAQLKPLALAAATLYGVLSHPGEAVAAAAWFTLVTWLMVRSGKFWNCVVAHAVTNLLLGIYVLATASWSLW